MSETERPDGRQPVEPTQVQPAVEPLLGVEAPGATAAPAPMHVPPRPRRRRWLFWPAVLLALGAIGYGGWSAWTAYEHEVAPETLVERWAEAFADGRSSELLALGALPEGDRSLLSQEALDAQRAIAPVQDLETGPVDVDLEAGTGSVAFSYVLGFAEGEVAVEDELQLERHDRGWRVSALATERFLDGTHPLFRLELAGAPAPNGSFLVFPGATPVSFDTPNLALVDEAQVVRLAEAEPDTVVEERPRLTQAAEAEIAAALDTAIGACLDGTAADLVLCPRPGDPRAIPGTARGTVTAPASEQLNVVLQSNHEGRVLVSGEVTLDGEFQTLDFNNQRVTETGEVTLVVSAWAYVTDLGTVTWNRS